MKKNKFPYILEITWAIVAIIALGIALHSTFTNGFSKSIVLYLLVLVAFLMYFVRRNRRTYEKNDNYSSQ